MNGVTTGRKNGVTNGVTTGRKNGVTSGDIYCVKCRRKTANKNVSVKRAKNGRLYQTGTCGVCGKRKSMFISRSGSGLIGNALGLPNGKVPILGDIPLIGGLF